MRAVLLIPAVAFVAACETVTPVSGVGFNTPEYQAQRESELAGQGVGGNPLVPPAAISEESLSPSGIDTTLPTGDQSNADDIASQTAAALASTSTQGSSIQSTLSASTPTPVINSSGISDEQDFEAVSGRRSIESDAARLEQNSQTYEVVTPTAIPERNAGGETNIVQYALSTSNPVGTQLYSRAGFNLQAKAQRNCARYPSPDQAQLEFLENGGPQRDRKGLDPDGDGYACSWDPSPFRRAVSN